MYHRSPPAVIEEPERIREDRFVDEIPDYLNCGICMEFVVDPKECRSCEHIFCNFCIETSRRTNPYCPSCRRAMTLKEINRNLKNSMNNLTIKCFNAPVCTVQIELCNVAAHEKACPMGEVPCIECLKVVMRKDLQHHMEYDCQMRKVTCRHCRATIKFKDSQSHESSCDYAPFSCSFCSGSICKKTKVAHDAVCPEQEIKCSATNTTGDFDYSNGSKCSKGDLCESQMRRRLMGIHLASECKYRSIPCPHCRDSIQTFILPYHEQKKCLKYVHKCTKCNGEYKKPDKHTESCPMEPVKCTWKDCVEEPLRKDLETHKVQCSQRLVECNHCKSNVKHCNLPSHLRNCPQFPLTCKKCQLKDIPRKEMSGHNGVCPMFEITCPVGKCAHKCLRRDLKTHFTNPAVAVSHIEELMLESATAKQKCSEHQNEVKKQQKEVQRLREAVHGKEEFITKLKANSEKTQEYITKLKSQIPASRQTTFKSDWRYADLY